MQGDRPLLAQDDTWRPGQAGHPSAASSPTPPAAAVPAGIGGVDGNSPGFLPSPTSFKPRATPPDPLGDPSDLLLHGTGSPHLWEAIAGWPSSQTGGPAGARASPSYLLHGTGPQPAPGQRQQQHEAALRDRSAWLPGADGPMQQQQQQQQQQRHVAGVSPPSPWVHGPQLPPSPAGLLAAPAAGQAHPAAVPRATAQAPGSFAPSGAGSGSMWVPPAPLQGVATPARPRPSVAVSGRGGAGSGAGGGVQMIPVRGPGSALGWGQQLPLPGDDLPTLDVLDELKGLFDEDNDADLEGLEGLPSVSPTRSPSLLGGPRPQQQQAQPQQHAGRWPPPNAQRHPPNSHGANRSKQQQQLWRPPPGDDGSTPYKGVPKKPRTRGPPLTRRVSSTGGGSSSIGPGPPKPPAHPHKQQPAGQAQRPGSAGGAASSVEWAPHPGVLQQLLKAGRSSTAGRTRYGGPGAAAAGANGRALGTGLPDAAAAGAAGKPPKKRKASAAGGGGAAGAAAGAAGPKPKRQKGAGGDGSGPTRAVRITREAGVEYDDICASGLSSQPFPVALDLFDLPHLSSILNLDTWQNVLEERDRQQLRALLPPGGLGEGPGGELEQLLQGEANLHFGKPVQRMWRGLQAGEFNPRVAKCREALLLLQRRCHAADVREYHNRCVQRWQHMGSVLRGLPPEATTSQRLTHWKEAEEAAAAAALLAPAPAPPPSTAAAAEDPGYARPHKQHTKERRRALAEQAAAEARAAVLAAALAKRRAAAAATAAATEAAGEEEADEAAAADGGLAAPRSMQAAPGDLAAAAGDAEAVGEGPQLQQDIAPATAGVTPAGAMLGDDTAMQPQSHSSSPAAAAALATATTSPGNVAHGDANANGTQAAAEAVCAGQARTAAKTAENGTEQAQQQQQPPDPLEHQPGDQQQQAEEVGEEAQQQQQHEGRPKVQALGPPFPQQQQQQQQQLASSSDAYIAALKQDAAGAQGLPPPRGPAASHGGDVCAPPAPRPVAAAPIAGHGAVASEQVPEPRLNGLGAHGHSSEEQEPGV